MMRFFDWLSTDANCGILILTICFGVLPPMYMLGYFILRLLGK